MTAYLDAGLSKEELTTWIKQMYKIKFKIGVIKHL